jgi:hypothetical protein
MDERAQLLPGAPASPLQFLPTVAAPHDGQRRPFPPGAAYLFSDQSTGCPLAAMDLVGEIRNVACFRRFRNLAVPTTRSQCFLGPGGAIS